MRQQLLSFIVSTPGRVIRGMSGTALMIYGMFFSGSAAGYVIAIIGLFTFATAAGDVCLMALGCQLPVEGSQTRAALRKGPR